MFRIKIDISVNKFLKMFEIQWKIYEAVRSYIVKIDGYEKNIRFAMIALSLQKLTTDYII